MWNSKQKVNRARQVKTPGHIFSIITAYIRRLLCPQTLVLTCSHSECKDTNASVAQSSRFTNVSQIGAEATSQGKCDTIRLIKSYSLTISFRPWLNLYLNAAAKPYHNKKYTYPDKSIPLHYKRIKLVYLHSSHTTRPEHPTAASVKPSAQASARRDFTLKHASSRLFHSIHLFAVVLLILRKWIKTVNNLHNTENQFHLKQKKTYCDICTIAHWKNKDALEIKSLNFWWLK